MLNTYNSSNGADSWRNKQQTDIDEYRLDWRSSSKLLSLFIAPTETHVAPHVVPDVAGDVRQIDVETVEL